LRGVRKKIAEHMSRSKRQAAHFSYVDEVDCTRLVELHGKLEPRAREKGVRLTYLGYFARAVARGLREHPRMNAHMDDERGEIVLKGAVNLGIAVDAPQGLMVPVVKGADRRSLYDLSTEIRRLAEEARAGRSRLEDLQGSTFTVTSVGSIGGMFATPILNYPEVGILGVNRIHERPVVRNGQIVVRSMVYLSLSLDHRAVDGAEGARFLNAVKGYLEEPALLFVEA
jgi:pyruvate dehydrogenase E2 component (dihydrolipoamide acetyltransferase)